MDTVACLCGNFKFHIFKAGTKFSSFCPVCGCITELNENKVLTSAQVIDNILQNNTDDCDCDEYYPSEMIR